MIRSMKAYWFASVAILLLLNPNLAAQSKENKADAKASGKQVIITLVRWPYT